ncbi:hypothetical protein ABH920_008726 [Catenulispora sp. EB89]
MWHPVSIRQEHAAVGGQQLGAELQHQHRIGAAAGHVDPATACPVCPPATGSPRRRFTHLCTRQQQRDEGLPTAVGRRENPRLRTIKLTLGKGMRRHRTINRHSSWDRSSPAGSLFRVIGGLDAGCGPDLSTRLGHRSRVVTLRDRQRPVGLRIGRVAVEAVQFHTLRTIATHKVQAPVARGDRVRPADGRSPRTTRANPEAQPPGAQVKRYMPAAGNSGPEVTAQFVLRHVS